LMARLMERRRGASEVTRDESEEGEEVERRRPRQEGRGGERQLQRSKELCERRG